MYLRERVDLWGTGYCTLPAWAVGEFHLTYRPSYIFDDQLQRDYGLAPLPFKRKDVLVSVCERAIIEHFSISLDGSSPEDLQNLIGSLRSPRLHVLQTLSDHCLRRDVVGTIRFMGQSEGYEWANRLSV